MIPTFNTILLVALFWTVPASAAALIYRAYGSSFDRMKGESTTDTVVRVGRFMATALPTA